MFREHFRKFCSRLAGFDGVSYRCLYAVYVFLGICPLFSVSKKRIGLIEAYPQCNGGITISHIFNFKVPTGSTDGAYRLPEGDKLPSVPL